MPSDLRPLGAGMVPANVLSYKGRHQERTYNDRTDVGLQREEAGFWSSKSSQSALPRRSLDGRKQACQRSRPQRKTEERFLPMYSVVSGGHRKRPEEFALGSAREVYQQFAPRGAYILRRRIVMD